ncbi:MAG TPA: TerC family protein [Tepidisphaeraceae bacterium]|nr:TerC family protein [Tepidisphaeraceae bacterium]
MMEMLLESFSLLAAAPGAVESGGHAPAGLTSLWSGAALMALVTLAALEIVLGIDNIVFIAILASRLPAHQQNKARQLGLGLAMGLRILLLLSISWIMSLTRPLFNLPFLDERGALSGRDLILLIGGLFLLFKATFEIHNKLEGQEHGASAGKVKATFTSVIIQILLLDIVFSLDSVITAVGMVQTDPAHKWVGLTVMIAAVVVAVGVMLVFARPVSEFVDRHPTVKMLALSFLLMIGVMLVAEAFDAHIPKGYVYFAMAFALGVEVLNINVKQKGAPVKLHQQPVLPGEPPATTSA